jgi:hypothetical protein
MQREGMKAYNGAVPLHLAFDIEDGNVKNMSFQGQVEPWLAVCLEAWAEMVEGKSHARMDQISLKETEAYLRDRNSELSIEGLGSNEEALFKSIIGWAKSYMPQKDASSYRFEASRGPFRNLKLAEKINEMKKFLSSEEVFSLYRPHRNPELVDVEDLTIYIDCPYSSEGERALFEKLHMMGIEVFGDEDLNFIPEG